MGLLTKCFPTNERVHPTAQQNENAEEIEGGDTPLVSSRKCTDVIWLILFLIFFIPLTGLLIYCILNGDIYRILNGYDRCGNVCGRVTQRFRVPLNNQFACHGYDMTYHKFLLVRGVEKINGNQEVNNNRECVKSCPASQFREFLNRCIYETSQEHYNIFISKTGLSNFFQEVSEDLDLCWREILSLCFVALGFSMVLLLMLRFAVGLVVWLMLGAAVLTCFISTIYLWLQWLNERDKLNRYQPQRPQSEAEIIIVYSYLGYAIVASVITIILLLLVIVLRSRVPFVVQLFEEAGKAISDIPVLLFQPWLTFAFLVMISALWLYLNLWIESSGMLTSQNNLNFEYRKDEAMKVTRWYHLLALFWLTQFVIAGQHMIVAGVIATWYFTRKKSQLEKPVMASTGCMLRYHLGSMAFGSFLIAMLQYIRLILQAILIRMKSEEENLTRDESIKQFSCFSCVYVKALIYINRNAYIQIAMRGCNFFEGAKRAFKIISKNALRVIAINSVGDFVLFLGKVAVVLSTMLVGIQLIQSKTGVHHVWVPITVSCLFSYLVVHSFMSIYEMAIDTIFVCFCEDCEINDGITKPYNMSVGLMECIRKSGELKMSAKIETAHGPKNETEVSTENINS